MLTESNNLNDLIKDGTESTFMSDVIETSKDHPCFSRFLGTLVRPVQNSWTRFRSSCVGC